MGFVVFNSKFWLKVLEYCCWLKIVNKYILSVCIVFSCVVVSKVYWKKLKFLFIKNLVFSGVDKLCVCI